MSVNVYHQATTGNYTFGVSFGIVEIQRWRSDRIVRLFRRWATHIENFDRVVVLESPTRFLAWSKGRKIVAPRISRRETQVGGRWPLIAMQACGWGLIIIERAIPNKGHCTTQAQRKPEDTTSRTVFDLVVWKADSRRREREIASGGLCMPKVARPRTGIFLACIPRPSPSLPLNAIDRRSPVIRLIPSCTPRRSSRPSHPRIRSTPHAS